jgi:hypothetical protein
LKTSHSFRFCLAALQAQCSFSQNKSFASRSIFSSRSFPVPWIVS